MASTAALDAAGHASERGTNKLLNAVLPAFRSRRRSGLSICVGVSAFLAAFLLRSAIHPILAPGFPFLTFFPAVILSTYLCGARAGILCATLSALAAWYCFIPPLNSFALDGSVVRALVLYAFVVGVDIFLLHILQGRADCLSRAKITARSLLDQQHRLVVDLRRETQSRVMHQQLAEKSLLLDLALRAANAGTWHYCVGSGRALLSVEMARQHGLGDTEIEIDLERDWRPLVHPDDADRTLANLASAIETRGTFETDFRILLPSGETRWLSGVGRVEVDARGEAEWVVGLTFDVTARKQSELRIDHLARHDPLTGLANRIQFHERFLQEIALAKREAIPFALLCLDLDRFKAVNDRLGHAVGDSLLCVVADRLRGVVRADDMVARLGGDEFVIVQTGSRGPVDAAILAERLTRAIETPILIEGHKIAVGVSIGIALVPSDGFEPDAIFRSADRAMYRAKADGRGTYRRAV